MNFRSILETIDRKFMPQVDHGDLPKAIELLKKNGIQVRFKYILSTQLSYSQKQVNKQKIINIVKDILRGKKMPPLVISNDNYIVDGHHRWIGHKLLNPRWKLKVIQIDLPKDEAIKLYKQVEGQLA